MLCIIGGDGTKIGAEHNVQLSFYNSTTEAHRQVTNLHLLRWGRRSVFFLYHIHLLLTPHPSPPDEILCIIFNVPFCTLGM